MPPGQSEKNPYDFITNPGTPKKAGFSFSDKQKPLVFGVFILIVLIIIGGGLLIFSKLTAEDNQDLLTVGGTQQQLIKLGELGSIKARSSQTKNTANTLLFSMQNDNNELKSYLSSRKIKVPKTGFPTDTKSIEDALTTAEQNNSFDEKFNELFDTITAQYKSQLKSAYQNAQKTKEKQLLEGFNQTIIVITGQKEE